MGIEPALSLVVVLAVALPLPVGAASFGIVSGEGDGWIRAYFPARISTDRGVSVQYPSGSRSSSCCLHFGRGQLEVLPTDPLAIDMSTGEPLRQIRMRDRARAFELRPFVGVAATGSARALRQTSPTTLRAGTLTARSCLSTEGFHVETHRAGRQVADYYLGLSYDIAHPTCRVSAASKTSTEK